MTTVAKTIHLGDEYDDSLRETLMRVLGEMGAQFDEGTRGVGGSQELETVRASIHGEVVEIEAETYVGLSVKATESLVEEIATRVRAQLRHR
jgi:hypothetical protein